MQYLGGENVDRVDAKGAKNYKTKQVGGRAAKRSGKIQNIGKTEKGCGALTLAKGAKWVRAESALDDVQGWGERKKKKKNAWGIRDEGENTKLVSCLKWGRTGEV